MQRENIMRGVWNLRSTTKIVMPDINNVKAEGKQKSTSVFNTYFDILEAK